MAFVNEYISKEDMESFSIKEIDKKVSWSGKTNSDSWTIDKDRGIYLRCVARGRNDYGYTGESFWTFLWHGELLWVELSLLGASSNGRNAPGWARKRITLLCLMGSEKSNFPERLVDQREGIIRDLHDALLAYKDGGVYSATTSYELFLEVAEEIYS